MRKPLFRLMHTWRRYRLWVILSKPVSTPPFLVDSRQAASHQTTMLLIKIQVLLSCLMKRQIAVLLLCSASQGRRWQPSKQCLQLDSVTMERSVYRSWLTFLLLPCVNWQEKVQYPPPHSSPGDTKGQAYYLCRTGLGQVAKAGQQSVKANGLLQLHAPGQATGPSEIRLCSDLPGRSSHI